MRIEGELLKLGISASATTIATELRRSGLGPAPRRSGPSWSEFLRAQAYGMLRGGLGSALGDDFGGEASKRSWPAQDREARQLEADDNLTSADPGEPQLASQLPVRSSRALPRPRVLLATRGPVRLRPARRSHARDGPESKPAARPTTRCSGATSKATAARHPASPPTTASYPSASFPGSSAPAASTQPPTITPNSQPEPSFFTPHADQRDADLIVVGSRERGFLERLLGRSVDEAVARRAERDVLLVH